MLTRCAVMFSMVAVAVLPASAVECGWYLLLPHGFLRLEQPLHEWPLRKWIQLSAHDSAAACEAARRRLIDEAARDLQETRRVPDPPPAADDPFIERASRNNLEAGASRCVAVSDPRLR